MPHAKHRMIVMVYDNDYVNDDYDVDNDDDCCVKLYLSIILLSLEPERPKIVRPGAAANIKGPAPHYLSFNTHFLTVL